MNYQDLTELLTRADAEFHHGNFAESDALCNEVLTTITQESTLSREKILVLRARSLCMQAESYRRRGMFAKAMPVAEDALAAALEANSRADEARAMCAIGYVHKETAEFHAALDWFSRALIIFEDIRDIAGISVATSNIGLVYLEFSDYSRALEYLNRSLAADEECGDKNGIAAGICNIGVVYFQLEDYTQALEYYVRALAICEELGLKAFAATNTCNIGYTYLKLSDYSRALEFLGRALGMFEKLGMKTGIAYTMGNIGTASFQMADYSRALEFFGRALAILEELGDKSTITLQISNIGEVYATPQFEDYNPEKAEEYLLRAIAMDKELGTKNPHIFKVLAGLYEQLERWKEANDYNKKHRELEKEILNNEVKEQAEKLAYERREAEREKHLAVERARAQATDDILANILPPNITERLLKGEKKIADAHENVSVLFVDIVGFTQLSAKLPAEELIDLLDIIFTRFDMICKNHGLEKIKTIGDAYMAVCGAPVAVGNHAERAAKAALEMLEDFSIEREFSAPVDLGFRIGLHSGSVIAGIIGENKYSYDLWGDAVNTAARMESHGQEDKIHCSEDFANQLGLVLEDKEIKPTTPRILPLHPTFSFSSRGEVEIKGKGIMQTYFLEKNI